MLKLRSLLLLIVIFVSLMVSSCSENSTSTKKKELIVSNEGAEIPHFNVVIGEIQKDGSVAILNKKVIVKDWEKELNPNLEVKISFSEVSIVKDDNLYFLRGKDVTKKSISKKRLVEVGGKLFEYLPDVERGGGHLSCTCSSGDSSDEACEPMYDVETDGWYCAKTKRGTCEKSVTIMVEK